MKSTFAIPGVPDATGYVVDALPERLEDAVDLLPFWQAKKDEMLLRVPYVGSFRAAKGSVIEVAPLPGVEQQALDVYLRGAVRAALIQQRGEIALHAASVSPPGGEFAVALCGMSAVGKSTLAAELCRRGWTLLADDLTRVQCGGKESIAWPSDAALRLWKDSCALLSIATEGLERVRAGVERFVHPVTAATEVLPLRLVLDLRHGGSGLERTAAVIDRMVLLNQHVFRRRQIAALGMQMEHGRAVMQLAAGVQAGVVHGSRTETVAVLADRVEEALAWTRR